MRQAAAARAHGHSARRARRASVRACDRKQHGAPCVGRQLIEAALLLDASRIDASRDPIASRRFDELMQEAQIVIEPVTGRRAEVAREVYRDFGKDSGHPARLNFKKTAKVSGRETKRQPAELNYTASQ